MASPAILKIDILADASKANAALGSVGKTAQTSGSKLGTYAKTAATAFAATAAIKFGKDSVKAFAEAEQSQKALSDAFDRFPKLADSSVKALQDYNTELARKTKYDDDSIAASQAVIAQFGLTGKQVESVTPLLLDYAAKTGKDLPAAAAAVGKASLGNARALKEIGINYKTTGNAAEDFANIQELLRQQVGGFAEKEGTTAAGQAAILANQFGEVQEQVGGALIPILMELAPVLQTVATFVQDNISWLLPLIAAIGGLVAVIKIVTIVQGIWNAVMVANPIGLIVIGIAALIVAIVALVKNWDKVKAAFMFVFDWVKRNWPLLLGILTGPIGAAVYLIVRNWDTIKRTVLGVFGAIKAAASDVWRWVVDKFNSMRAAIIGAFSGVADIIKRPINAVINMLNGFQVPRVTIGGGDPLGIFGPSLPEVTIGGWGFPHIPRLATGGSVLQTGLAVVHRGETFSGVGNTMGGSTVINVNVTAAGLGADSPEIQRAVVKALRGYVGRNGPLPIPVRSVA